MKNWGPFTDKSIAIAKKACNVKCLKSCVCGAKIIIYAKNISILFYFLFIFTLSPKFKNSIKNGGHSGPPLCYLFAKFLTSYLVNWKGLLESLVDFVDLVIDFCYRKSVYTEPVSYTIVDDPCVFLERTLRHCGVCDCM